MAHVRKTSLTRRSFLATAAGGLTAPYFIPASALGKDGRPAPSNRITVGTIGSGGMGRGNTNSMMRYEDCQLVAVCDVDQQHLAKAKEDIDKKYGNKDCRTYADYRELCAAKDIDAVIIATPDHWHALAGIEAAQNKKDIYCQKPITHTFAEGKRLVEAVKKNNVIFQVGSQQRSSWMFRYAAELVMNGYLGKIKHVEIGLPTGHRKPNGDATPQDPPASLNYDMWTGPAKMLPYMPARSHFHWRWNLAYGGGQMMDWIGHHNDITHWALGRDGSGPVEVQAVGFQYNEDRSVYDSAWAYDVQCTYDDGVTTSISNKYPNGCKFIGEEGAIFVSRGDLKAFGKDGQPNDEASKEIRKKEFNRGPKTVYLSEEHHRNFLDCIKSRQPCICPAETGHRSITPGHLGMISDAVGGRKLKWDPAKEQFVGDADAQKLLEKLEFRQPWQLA